MATLHIIHGFVGAGKTTFSKKLEHEIRAVRFTPDEWIRALYGLDESDFDNRQDRIYGLIRKIAARVLAAGTDVILDFGFWSRAERDRARDFARENGAEFRLYSLECPPDVMRARTLARTAEMPEGALRIDENALDLFMTRFEPLGADEDRTVVKTG